MFWQTFAILIETTGIYLILAEQHKHSSKINKLLLSIPSKKGPLVPTGTIINPFKTEKTAANGNLRQWLKWKPQAKRH